MVVLLRFFRDSLVWCILALLRFRRKLNWSSPGPGPNAEGIKAGWYYSCWSWYSVFVFAKTCSATSYCIVVCRLWCFDLLLFLCLGTPSCFWLSLCTNCSNSLYNTSALSNWMVTFLKAKGLKLIKEISVGLNELLWCFWYLRSYLFFFSGLPAGTVAFAPPPLLMKLA